MSMDPTRHTAPAGYCEGCGERLHAGDCPGPRGASLPSGTPAFGFCERLNARHRYAHAESPACRGWVEQPASPPSPTRGYECTHPVEHRVRVHSDYAGATERWCCELCDRDAPSPTTPAPDRPYKYFNAVDDFERNDDPPTTPAPDVDDCVNCGNPDSHHRSVDRMLMCCDADGALSGTYYRAARSRPAAPRETPALRCECSHALSQHPFGGPCEVESTDRDRWCRCQKFVVAPQEGEPDDVLIFPAPKTVTASYIPLAAVQQAMYEDEEEHTVILKRLRALASPPAGAGKKKWRDLVAETMPAGTVVGHAGEPTLTREQVDALIAAGRDEPGYIHTYATASGGAPETAPLTDDLNASANLWQNKAQMSGGSSAYRQSLWDRVARLRALAGRPVEAPGGEPKRLAQVPNGCWLACIASLTDIPHDELTALLVHQGDEHWKSPEFHNAVNQLLRERGWRLAYIGADVPRGYAIGSGMSPRGVMHATITKDGALWHDPHPSGEGVESFTDFEVVLPIRPLAAPTEAKDG